MRRFANILDKTVIINVQFLLCAKNSGILWKIFIILLFLIMKYLLTQIISYYLSKDSNGGPTLVSKDSNGGPILIFKDSNGGPTLVSKDSNDGPTQGFKWRTYPSI